MSYPDPYVGAPMRDEPPGTEGQSQFKAFVGGLSYQINYEDLRKAFERYDAISAEVMVDRHTGRPRGFGFVYFKDEQGLKDAIEQMHEKELEGRRISVTRAVPQDQTKPGTPAAILGGGSGARRDWDPRDSRRDERPPPPAATTGAMAAVVTSEGEATEVAVATTHATPTTVAAMTEAMAAAMGECTGLPWPSH
ncbi:hypothetical protein V8C86DRAFT_1666728 [Haematococcus lacustris]